MAFDILELPEIPRDKAKLTSIVGSARYERRKSRIIRVISGVIIGLALVIMFMSAIPGSSAPSLNESLYLPTLMR